MSIDGRLSRRRFLRGTGSGALAAAGGIACPRLVFSSAMPSYVATAVKAHFMLFSDYGILNHGTTVMTQPKRVVDESQLCAAFVDGIMQGLKATLLDPGEAIKVFFKQVPEMALATQAREQRSWSRPPLASSAPSPRYCSCAAR
jgi:hypothetical protein